METTHIDRFKYHLKALAWNNTKKYFNATKGFYVSYPWGSYIDKTVGKLCKTAAIETFSYAYVLFLIKKVKKKEHFYWKCFFYTKSVEFFWHYYEIFVAFFEIKD